MYKGLKPELEEVIRQIRIGDGIVIKHPAEHYADRTIGYVRSINPSDLTLTKTRESRLFLETLFGHLMAPNIRYADMESIIIVDPEKTD
jgi:hypothetical protein